MLLLPFTLLAQLSDKTIYLDSLSFETVQGKHESYRIVKGYFFRSKTNLSHSGII